MHYLSECRAAIRAGRPIPPPEDQNQLRAALLRFPREAARYRPSRDDLRGMGLPLDWCRPWRQPSRERLLATLASDPELRRELREVLQ